MVAINSLTMLVLYGVLGGFCWASAGCRCPGRRCCCPSASTWPCRWWPGYVSRRWIIAAKGEAWFKEKFLHVLTPHHDHRAADHAGAAVQLQGRGHPRPIR
jgi:arsenite transporter